MKKKVPRYIPFFYERIADDDDADEKKVVRYADGKKNEKMKTNRRR